MFFLFCFVFDAFCNKLMQHQQQHQQNISNEWQRRGCETKRKRKRDMARTERSEKILNRHLW